MRQKSGNVLAMHRFHIFGQKNELVGLLSTSFVECLFCIGFCYGL